DPRRRPRQRRRRRRHEQAGGDGGEDRRGATLPGAPGSLARAPDDAARGPRRPWWPGPGHRLTNRPVRHSVALAYSGGERGIANLLRTVAAAVNARPQEAAIEPGHGLLHRRARRRAPTAGR